MSISMLTHRLKAKIERLFSRELPLEVSALLEEHCGSAVPLIDAQGADGIERIRSAALKVSDGSLVKLRLAVQLANIDWRDVLVAAGFAHSLEAHVSWLEDDNHA